MSQDFQAAATQRPVHATGIVLENDDLRAAFDKDTGDLIELAGKAIGWQFQRRPELGLSFELLVPLPEKRNNPVYGTRQKLTRYELFPDKNAVSFFWDKLVSEQGGVLDINLSATAALDSSGLTFTMKVDNHSPYTVEAVAYPAIGDLSQPNATEELMCSRVAYVRRPE
jgi:hypothetical protein